jgi:hypothetical protein
LQVAALDEVIATFTNTYGTDGPLLAEVTAVRAGFRARGFPASTRWIVDPPVAERQRRALGFLLATFPGFHDIGLRAVVLAKLGQVGTAADLPALLPNARYGVPGELVVARVAMQQIAARGLPPGRRDSLEDRLTHDTPLTVVKHSGSHLHDVYFATFAGMEGVWKPERSWHGQKHCFAAREVAACVLDRLLGTHVVPATVERFLDVGRGPEWGSMQLKVPGARALGRSPTTLDPTFDALRATIRYRAQEQAVRALLYILGDPDKFPCALSATPNFMNLLVDKNEKLWMIDNGYSLGAAGGDIEVEIIGRRPNPELAEGLSACKPAQVVRALAPYIGAMEAARASARLTRAAAFLRDHS